MLGRVSRLDAGSPWEYFQVAARLHATSIHHGLLPLLGEGFLARLYFEVARAPEGGVWIVEGSGGVPLAFLAGCSSGTIWRRVAMRGALAFSWRVLLRLLRPAVLAKLPSIVTYPFRASRAQAQAAGGADLLAIAVEDAARGQGAGARLVAEFESFLRRRGVQAYRVATNVREEGSNAFYRRSGFLPAGTIQHHGLTLQLYTKDLSSGPEDAALSEP